MTTTDNALPTSTGFTLERVGDGAWAAIAIPGTGSMGNAGIVDLGSVTVVFDTMLSLAAARDLRAAAEKLTGRAPRYVVNSHYHLDHVQGNQVFDDATIIGTPQTAELIAAENAPFLATMRERGLALDVEAREEAAAVNDPVIQRDMNEQNDDNLVLLREAAEARARLPDVRFESRLTLHGDARHAELITWGGGHTPSDSALYLPHARILYAGDLIFQRAHAYIQTGDPLTWTRMLDGMEKLSVDVLIPGHGPVTDHGAIAAQRAYLVAALDLVRDALAAGKSEDETAETPIPAAYRDWLFPSGFSGNMRAIYAYLRDHEGKRHAARD